MSTPLITPTVRQNGVAQISLAGPHKRILLSLLSAAPRLALLLFMGVAGVRVAQAFRNQIGDPWPDLAVSLPLLVLLFAAGIILLATAEIIDRRWHPPTEYIRKFAHIGAGAIAFFAPVFFSTHLPVFVLAIMFSVALLAGRRLGWLASLHLPVQRGKGNILFLWAVYLVFLLAEGHGLMFQVPLLVLTVGDAAAALIGQRYGRIQYGMSDGARTVEGSMAFVGATLPSVLFLLIVFTEMALVQCAVLSILVAFLASAVEAITPKGLDNLSIPIVTLFILEAFLIW